MPSHQQIVFILLIKEFSLSNNIYSKVKKVITVLTLIFIKKNSICHAMSKVLCLELQSLSLLFVLTYWSGELVLQMERIQLRYNMNVAETRSLPQI